MREGIFDFNKAVSIYKNKFSLYEKKSFDEIFRGLLCHICFAFLTLYIESTEWTYAVTFNEETIKHGV